MSLISTYLVLGAHVANGVSLIDLLDLPDLPSYSIEFLLVLLDPCSAGIHTICFDNLI